MFTLQIQPLEKKSYLYFMKLIFPVVYMIIHKGFSKEARRKISAQVNKIQCINYDALLANICK